MHLDRVPKVAKYLSVVMLFAYLGRSAVWFFLPIYIERHIASVFLVGLITSLPPAIPILLDIPVSSLVQRIGEKFVISAGLITAILPGLLYIPAVPALIVAAKASEGLAKVLIWNGGWSLSLKSSDSDVESETASIFLLGINLSVIIGPVFGGFVIAQRGFEPMFYIWMATAAIGVYLFYHFIGMETEGSVRESIGELFERKTYLEEFQDFEHNFHDLRKPLVLITLYSVLLSFNWLVIPLLLNKLDADFVTMGIVFGIAGLPWLFQFLWASLADRIGASRVIQIVSLGSIPILFALSIVDGKFMVGGLFIAAKVMLSGFSPAAHSIFDARVPEKDESEMTGFLEFFKHIGQTAGPVAAGTIASIYSLNASFLGAGIIAILILAAATIDF